jgi:uncharacterized protein YhbP (UPF0306 family)
MRITRQKTKHQRLSSTGVEMAGALIVASQVAYLSPPGFDEWVRLQTIGDAEAARRESSRSAELR